MEFAGDVFDCKIVVLERGEPSGYSLVYFSGVFPKGEVRVIG